MGLDTKGTSLYLKRLNNRLRQNPTWTGLFGAVDSVINALVTPAREQLGTVRDPRLYHRGQWLTTGDGQRAIINHIKMNADGSALVYAQVVNRGEVVEITLDTNLKDREVIIASVQRKGFRYFSDTFTTDDYALINDWVEHFWPQSGTDNYYRFIGFIKNIKLSSDTLWTSEIAYPNAIIDGNIRHILSSDKNTEPTPNTVALDSDGRHLINTTEPDDAYPFLEPRYNDSPYVPVWEGGQEYPTSHVQLRYDPIVFPGIDNVDLLRLFYLLAPIQLVLKRIVWDLQTDAITLVTAISGVLADFQSARYEFDITTLTHSGFFTSFGGLTCFESAIIDFLPPIFQDLQFDHAVGFNGSVVLEKPNKIIPYPASTQYQLTFFDETGTVVAISSSATGTLQVSNGLLSVSNSTVPTLGIDTYSYILEQKTTLTEAWRIIYEGFVQLTTNITTDNIQTIYINRDRGFSFSGFIQSDNQDIDETQYDYVLLILNNGSTVIVASTDNGRLYYTAGALACFIPLNVLAIEYNLYQFILNSKPKANPNTAYQQILAGDLVVLN